MAPEFLDTSEPSYASDSYSFGLVCIEVRIEYDQPYRMSLVSFVDIYRQNPLS